MLPPESSGTVVIFLKGAICGTFTLAGTSALGFFGGDSVRCGLGTGGISGIWSLAKDAPNGEICSRVGNKFP